MSAASAATRPAGRRVETRAAYRDDGVLARALGRALGPALRGPAPALTLGGALPGAILLLAERDAAPLGAVGGVIAWYVLLAGAASGRPDSGRLRWVVPPLLRLFEYGTLVWLGALAGGGALPAVFALLAATAFHHYDVIYRLRYQGVVPPLWLRDVAGGWELRLIAAFLLLAGGELRLGLYAAAGVLAALFLSESVRSWIRLGSAGRAMVYDEEEDEGE